jgi:NitT/TauT family transport system ATP-binding protein
VVSGLISPSAGKVLLGDKHITGQPAHMVYSFKKYSKSLLPWFMSSTRRFSLPIASRL